MANDEFPKIEPTLTSVSDAPSVVPAAEIPTPDAVKPEGSMAETAKVDAKRQAYHSSVLVRMPPGSSSAAPDAGVVVKPNVTRLALLAALMAIAASFGAVGGSVGVAKFGPIFASAPQPVAPATKDNVAEEMKALRDTGGRLRATP